MTRRLALLLTLTALSAAIRAQAPDLDPTAELLAELIRVDTSNPPGNEARIADLLAPRLRTLGFQVDIVPTPQPGKAALFARLAGDGSRRPILLAAHADVVGVERDKWSLDPFGGVIRDGHVYGRGAIDFKGGMAVFVRAVMMLAEKRVPLARDVILLVEPDEEGAQYNTSWLAQSHWAQMDCEFALNEGGWIIKRDDGRVRYVSISTADKSSVAVKIVARGTSTHSSMPRPDNAIFALARALARLSSFDPRLELTPSTRRFFGALAATSDPPDSNHYRALSTSDQPADLARADQAVSRDPLLHALIRNTLAPVLINGGFRSNVIPGSAEATINVRLIPGTDVDALVADIQTAIHDPNVEVVAPPRRPAVPESPVDTELYQALARQARATFTGAEVTPYLFQAGTDAGAWRSRGIPVYGIYPYPITAEELTRMHGNDERVSIESLRQGTEMIFNTLVEVAGRK